MSFEAKDSAVRNKQLQVQELCVTKADTGIVVASGSDYIVKIGEELVTVLCVEQILAAGGSVASLDSADVSIVDSAAYTAGGDKKAIKCASLTLATGDVVRVKYVVKN